MKPIARVLATIVGCLGVPGPAPAVSLSPHGAFHVEGEGTIRALGFSNDGNLLLAGGEHGRLVCWDLAGGAARYRTDLGSGIAFVAFQGDGPSAMAVLESGAVVETGPGGEGASSWYRSPAKPVRVALDAGGRFLAIAGSDGRIRLCDARARMAVGEIDARDLKSDIIFLGFDRLGQQLVAISRQGEAASWNPVNRQRLRRLSLAGGELHGSRSVIQAAGANREANVFVVGLQEVALPKGGLSRQARFDDLVRRNMLVAYDWNTGSEIKRIPTPARIDRLAVGPGNDHVAATHPDTHTLALMDLRKAEIAGSASLAGEASALVVAECDRWLAVGTENGDVSIWELELPAAAPGSLAAAPLPGLGGRIRVVGASEPALPPGQPITLALLGLEAKGLPQETADLCLDAMSSYLANVEHLTLVERRRIDEVASELRLQMTGLTEQDGAQIGKILNADVVLLGSMGTLGSTYVISVRLIKVETAEVTHGRQVICEECRDQDIFDAVNLLAGTIAR